MATVICLLKGVNLAAHHRMKMDSLRRSCESLGLKNPRTLLQSGNVVFETGAQNLEALATRIEQEIERTFGFHSDVILRTASQMRRVVETSPFAARTDLHPGKLAVTFLAGNPDDKARETVAQLRTEPEELHVAGRELYIYFPNSMGRTKLPMSRIEKALGTPATSRNWNTVMKLLEMAENR